MKSQFHEYMLTLAFVAQWKPSLKAQSNFHKACCQHKIVTSNIIMATTTENNIWSNTSASLFTVSS